ncbi:VOC family protein, partial [Streptomyces nigra]
MAEIRKVQITFDCAEPERLARFWCEVLGYVVPSPPSGFATWDAYWDDRPEEKRGAWFACQDPSGEGPRLFFQRVPEGKVVNRLARKWVGPVVRRPVAWVVAVVLFVEALGIG